MQRTTHAFIPGLAILLAGADIAPGAAIAQNRDIHYIECGDEISEGTPAVITAWEAANPGFKIKTEVVPWGQCEEKAKNLAAAGEPAGLAYVGSRNLKLFYNSDLIVTADMTAEERDSYWPTILGTVEYNGKILGLPRAFSTKSLYYNKDLFRKAGLDPERPPATWEALFAAAEAIDEKADTDDADVKGYGLVGAAFDNTMHQFLNWVYTNGGSVIEGDEITLDSPNNVEALTWYNKMRAVSQDGPIAYKRDDLRPLFNDGKIGMFVDGPWTRNRINEDIDWGVAPLPVGPKGKPGTLLITDSLAVFKGSGVEAQAMSFAKLLTNPENQFFYEKTHGLTPLRPVEGVGQLVDEDPTWKPFLDGIAAGGPEPLFEDFQGLQEAMIDAVQSVLLDEATPAEAIATAAETLENLE